MRENRSVERRGGCGSILFLLLLVGGGIYWGVNKYQAVQAEGNADAWEEALAPVNSAGDRLETCLGGQLNRLGACSGELESLATASANLCDNEDQLGAEVPELNRFYLQSRIDKVHNVCTAILNKDTESLRCSLVNLATGTQELAADCLLL